MSLRIGKSGSHFITPTESFANYKVGNDSGQQKLPSHECRLSAKTQKAVLEDFAGKSGALEKLEGIFVNINYGGEPSCDIE